MKNNFKTNMNKIYSLMIVGFLILGLNITFMPAHTGEAFEQAEQIIKDKILCSQITDEQLEILGDYYMEQMHPGEQHEIMDKMMGGEGSASLKEIHINMGKAFYCGEHTAMSSGMMNQMMGRNMMSSNGMMSGYYGFLGMAWFGWLFMLLVIVVLVLLIIWLIRQLQDNKKTRKRRR